MSIERMESILLMVPSSARERFADWLYGERQVHVEEFQDASDAWNERFASPDADADANLAEDRVTKLQTAIETLREFDTTPADFLESLFPVKKLATAAQIDVASKEVDATALSEKSLDIRRSLDGIEDEKERLASERERLVELGFLGTELEKLASIRHLAFRFVCATGKVRDQLRADERLTDTVYAEPVSVDEPATYFVLAAPASQASVLGDIIADYGLRELHLPGKTGTIAEAIAAADAHALDIRARELALRKEGTEVASTWMSRAQLALAYWQSELNRMARTRLMAASPYLFTMRGYIRTANLEAFQSRLASEFPGAELVHFPAPEGEEPPVSMAWGNFLRPAGLLVKMFGLPSYRGIDPTAFLSVTFFMFFGICFGDVLYGSMLLGLSYLLRRRFRDQKGLVEFFRLFTYAAYSTIFFGILVGSWGADLTSYFGAGNPVDRLRLKLMLLDPIVKPVVALIIAVGIGVVNQLYGIFMRFLRDVRRGDYASAVYDGVFWIVYLVSLMVFAVGASMGAPAAVTRVALVIFGLAAVGLVLTQGRDEPSLAGRIITGVVSLYGIMGTYGTTSFVGDVISYSRLMALGMTTSVVGMSFNIIAGMLKEVPYVGWLLFAIVAVFGHLFNFVMSILSAFVHSARLILLEWFGRFYEGGGKAFEPYGFANPNLDVIEG